MEKKYHCDICMGIHESMKELFDIGLISEAEMREFDDGCLVAEPAMDTVPEFFGASPEPPKVERVAVQYSAG